ncbi:uncharacterized protein LOC120197028 [Hibiscus syriacus]|uniref:uncharacterized protein LOC120197028 n=1 Tax=Hibiscus syriacus TaxID=106335 RepID=UPI001922DE1E|nr:uncharacterized protein LOC120197028 [Hibiscus syriacus]
MKHEFITPIQSIQSRRKSCFFKLQDIDEGRVTRERGKSLSLSPNSRKTVSKVIAPKPAATTALQDGEKPVSARKPLKHGRVVGSRYNQFPNQSNVSFTVSDAQKQESNKHDKRCVSNERIVDSCKNEKSENRMKKWEIPSEVIILKEESPQSIGKINDLLPKIRTVRVWHESPRASGPAKRVAELMGRKPYFSMEEETENSVRQALSLAEGDGEKE